jgi:hypothetical protein
MVNMVALGVGLSAWTVLYVDSDFALSQQSVAFRFYCQNDLYGFDVDVVLSSCRG